MNQKVILFLMVEGVLMISGLPQPQGGYSYGNSNSYSNRPGSFGASGGGSGGGGGGLNSECRRQEVSPGRFRFVCEDKNIALRSEHILWLQSNGGQQQILDIEVPNYKIQELIKAGYKGGPGQGTKINVLLKKPEQSYDAQVDVPPSAAGEPSVSLQYEPVDKTVVHFPNDKPYSPLSGPILPPLRGGRPQRQTPKQFSKPKFEFEPIVPSQPDPSQQEEPPLPQ